jgi:Coenzyme PQQ synthesis protein D (PqqD)
VKVNLARDVTITPIEEGAVLLDGRRGRYWQVNGSGATALRALLDGESLEVIAVRLSATVPVSSEQVMADVKGLINALSDASLVDIV